MKNSIKVIVLTLLVSALAIGVFSLFANGTFDRLTHPGKVKIAGLWVDDTPGKEIKAGFNGDTYCKRCDKYIEGTVRICPYCGQYIHD